MRNLIVLAALISSNAFAAGIESAPINFGNVHVDQVTGQALGMQVTGARRVLVSGFGMINFDRGLCSGAVVLEGV